MEYQTSPRTSSSSSSPTMVSVGWPATSSATSSPRSIGSTASTSSNSSISSLTAQLSSSSNLTTAYPSWPTGRNLTSSPSFGPYDSQSNVPSSFISDFELFGCDDEDLVPFLDEAPAAPRMYGAPVPVAMPLLPLYAPEKPKKRRRSSKKQVPRAKPMTPIAESPVAAPE